MKAKSKKTSSYHHNDLREALLTEGLQYIKKNKIEDLSLRDLARRLKVSHTAPYRHYATKEALMADMIKVGFIRLTEGFDLIFQQHNDFKEMLRAMGLAYVQFMLDNEALGRLMFGGFCEHGKYPETEECGNNAFGRLIQLILIGQEKSYFKKEDPMKMAYLIWSSVHGLSMLLLEKQFEHVSEDHNFSCEMHVDYMTETLLKGLS